MVEWVDTGSNSSLIRSKFTKQLNLKGNGLLNVRFGIAGGGIPNEKAEDFDLQIRQMGGKEIFFITATGIGRPCFYVKPIKADILSRYKHLADMKDNLFIDGGGVDVLIEIDYAPLILPENVLRDSQHPDDSPSVAITRLGSYIYGGLSKSTQTVNRVLSINFVNKLEENELNTYFYGDIIGVRPTSLCICTDNQIVESAFIKHVRATTKINSEDVYASNCHGNQDSLNNYPIITREL